MSLPLRARLALLAVPAAFLTVLFVWPVASIVATGLRPDGRWAGGDAVDTVRENLDTLGFTVWQAVLSTVLTFALALPGAWALARIRFRGKGLVRVLVTVPFVLPTVVVATAVRGLVGPQGVLGSWIRLDESLVAIVAAHAFFNYAVVVWVVGERWAHLDRRVEEAARMLGDSRWAVLRRVTLPLLAPSLLAAALLVFLFCATSFGVVVLLGGPQHATVEVAIARATRTVLDLPGAAALSMVQLVMVAVLLVLHGRLRDRRQVAVGQAAETDAARPPSGLAERVGLVAVLGSMALFLGGPIAVLVERSLRVDDGYGLAWYRGLSTAARGSTLFVPPLEAIRTSLGYAAIATAVAVVVGGAAALAVAARADRLSRGADAVLALPLGASAVTVGLGFLVALDRPPLDLRGSPVLVPLAHALVGVPFVVRVLVPVLRSIDPRLREAAGMLGAGPWRRLRDIDLVIAGRAVLGAAGFAFAISLGEFGATTVIARADTPTVPVAIDRLLG
ncbi:MAG TPA: ABC transporter permease subunit, partial [Acidimicrobiales bacterium]|nr:ABC transporter permease subunit [Acidimicrobiales bacterium]